MRKWYFDGEKPVKTKNENGRRAWETKYKFLPVTVSKCLPDDIPLFLPSELEKKFSSEPKKDTKAVKEISA